MLYFIGISSFIIQICNSAERLQSWSYLNMHCRDNENNPVDWWYIYKPPTVSESSTDGLNFTYLIPRKRGFTASSKYIDGNSMLQYTLAPFYMPKYKNYMAVVTYYNKDMSKRSNSEGGIQAHGIMMADEKGGIWMGHTVPNLLDLKGVRNKFPREEISSGHLLTCLSLDIDTLNLIADIVKETHPTVTAMNIPVNVRKNLPGWLKLKGRSSAHDKFRRLQNPMPALPFEFLTRDKSAYVMVLARKPGDSRCLYKTFAMRLQNPMPALPFEFLTRDKSAYVMVLARKPGDSRCLYKTFAMYKNVILDVYQHDGSVQPFCEPNYGLRNIESISLKYDDGDVYYINNQTDKSNFAVNTAAVWQETSKAKNQFWACTSNIEQKDGGSMGGIAMCVESYSVWWAFTNFKVREPSCPSNDVVQLII